MAPSIAALRIASSPEAWERAGFTVREGVAVVGGVEIRLEGGDGGIAGWAVRDAAPGEIDGLPTEIAGYSPDLVRPAHQNTAQAIDHIVVFTPELDRTVAALGAAGFDLRRTREADEPGPPVRQAFFRPSGVIVEVVENPRGKPGPAAFWGLTLTVLDIDLCADLLGEHLGEVHDAVQPGRRIASVRSAAGLGVPVALISPHPA